MNPHWMSPIVLSVATKEFLFQQAHDRHRMLHLVETWTAFEMETLRNAWPAEA
jgi:hypothetical protein